MGSLGDDIMSTPLLMNYVGVLRHDVNFNMIHNERATVDCRRSRMKIWAGCHPDHITFTRRRLPLDNALWRGIVVNAR